MYSQQQWYSSSSSSSSSVSEYVLDYILVRDSCFFKAFKTTLESHVNKWKAFVKTLSFQGGLEAFKAFGVLCHMYLYSFVWWLKNRVVVVKYSTLFSVTWEYTIYPDEGNELKKSNYFSWRVRWLCLIHISMVWWCPVLWWIYIILNFQLLSTKHQNKKKCWKMLTHALILSSTVPQQAPIRVISEIVNVNCR